MAGITAAHVQVKVSVAMTDFEKDLQGLQSQFNKVGARLQTAGSAMTKALTLPLAGLATAAIASGLKFETAMNQIQGVMRPTTAQMGELRTMALKMGADTIFSATDAATAMLELGKAGFSVEDSLSSVDEVMQLAAASGLSMGEAAELSARSLNAFGLQTSDLAHVNDVLAAAVNNTSLEITDLQTAFNYIGPIAQGFGISIETTAAALGIMRDAGVQAETAGRSMREGLGRLANPVKAVKDVMAELGIETFKTANGSLMPFSDIIGLLHDKGLTAAQSLKLFGDAAGPGMFALVSKGAPALDELTRKLILSDDAAKDMADAMMKGLPGAFEQLKGSLETAGIAISKALEPALVPILNGLTAIANMVATTLVPAFQSLPTEIQVGVLAFVGFAAAVGPATYAVGAFMRAAAGVITTLRATGIAAFVGELVGLTTATQGAAAAQTALQMSGVLTAGRTYTDVAAGMSAAGRAASSSSIMIAGMSAAGRAATGSTSVLASALSMVMGAFVAAAGPVGLFIAAMYGLAKAAQSETFLHWASTSDSMAASAIRAASGHDRLTEAQFKQAHVAMLAGDANEIVSAKAAQLRQELIGAELDVKALAQAQRELIAEQNTDPSRSDSVARGLTVVAQRAKALKDQGQQLTPELAALVAQFDRMQTASSGAGAGLSEVAQEAEAAKKRIKDLHDELSGAAAITSATEMASALRGVDVSTISPEKQVRIFETMHEAVTRLGSKAPKEFLALEQATMGAAAAAGKYGSAIDRADLEYFIAQQKEGEHGLIAMENAFHDAVVAAEKVPQALPGFLNELPSAAAEAANIASLAGHGITEAMRAVKPPAWWSQFFDAHGLQTMGNAFIGLGHDIGGASGHIVASVGGMMDALGKFKEVGAPKGALANVAALAQAAGATWQASKQGVGAGMMQGAMSGMAWGWQGAAAGAAAGGLMAMANSGPTEEDLASAREMVKDWGSTVVDQFAKVATAQQQMTASSDRAAMINAVVTNTYRDIGKSALEATVDIRRLEQAQVRGSAATARVLGDIQEKFAKQKQLMQDWATGVGEFNSGFASRVGGFADMMERTSSATDDAAASFQRMGVYAVMAFAQTFEQTKSVTAALAAVKDPLAKLTELQKQFGFEGSAAYAKLGDISAVVQANADVFNSLDGLNQMMQGLQTATMLTHADMQLFGQDATSLFDSLVSRNVDANTAMALMQPTLQALWEHAQKFGEFTDAGTQALINQAETAGIVGEEQRSVMERVLDVLVQIAGVLETRLPAAMTAAQSAFDYMAQAFPKTPSADAVDTGLTAVQRTAVPAFANEGIVSRPTLALIGDAPEPEMVLRKSTVAALASGGGGKGLTVIVNVSGGTIIGSSSEFENSVLRAMNRGLQRNGTEWGEHEKIVKQMVRSS